MALCLVISAGFTSRCGRPRLLRRTQRWASSHLSVLLRLRFRPLSEERAAQLARRMSAPTGRPIVAQARLTGPLGGSTLATGGPGHLARTCRLGTTRRTQTVSSGHYDTHVFRPTRVLCRSRALRQAAWITPDSSSGETVEAGPRQACPQHRQASRARKLGHWSPEIQPVPSTRASAGMDRLAPAPCTATQTCKPPHTPGDRSAVALPREGRSRTPRSHLCRNTGKVAALINPQVERSRELHSEQIRHYAGNHGKSWSGVSRVFAALRRLS